MTPRYKQPGKEAASDLVTELLLGWVGGHASLVMVADESGQVVLANDATCAWRGHDRQQVLQERIQDIDDALWREWSDPDHPRWQPGRFSKWQSWHETEDGRRVATSFRLQALTLREQRFLMLVSGELYPVRMLSGSERLLSCRAWTSPRSKRVRPRVAAAHWPGSPGT